MPICEIKEISVKGLKSGIHYKRISVTLGSVIAGGNCTLFRQNLQRDNHPRYENMTAYARLVPMKKWQNDGLTERVDTLANKICRASDS